MDRSCFDSPPDPGDAPVEACSKLAGVRTIE